MAEYVKWRLTRARAGVTMALFGLLAGLGLRASESEPASFERSAALTRFPANSVGSAQVRPHSLLLSDMKEHQVASYASFAKVRKDTKILDALFAKVTTQLDGLSASMAKVNDALSTFETKADAGNAFLGKADTAVNAAKIENVGLDGLIQGHGSVLTGEVVPSQTPGTLLAIPGTLTLQGVKDPGANAMVSILNNSSQSILISGSGGQESVSPGKSSTPVDMGDGSVHTFQVLVNGDGRVVTLSVSGYGSGGASGLVGQALLGNL